MCRIKACRERGVRNVGADLVENGSDLGEQGLHVKQACFELLYIAVP